MSPRAIAFVPCAPLLVPAVAGGSAEADAELRAEAIAAVRGLAAASPDEIVVVAPTSHVGAWPAAATWDFSGFGVRREPADPVAAPALPWPLGIGAWLLAEAGWDGDRRYVGIPPDGEAATSRLAAAAAVLVLGDGSACRTEKAPGHLDPRAEAFDTAIAAGLAAGDVRAVTETDATLAAELMCAGLPVWRWLATQLAGRPVTDATLVSHRAPYGVGYFVASWLLA